MNHKHRAVLHSLFAHPISTNIDPKLLRATLEEAGAQLAHNGKGRVMVTLNGASHGFHDNHHSLSKEEVVEMRKFLTDAGIDPARDYPL
jgi:hypothetical protein